MGGGKEEVGDDGLPIDYDARRKWELENRHLWRNKHIHFGSSWGKAHIGGKLTDKKITQYVKKGYYTDEFRRERKKRHKEPVGRREGNFIVMPDGSEIYSPL